MNYVKTTVRLKRPLKEMLDNLSLQLRTPVQELINQAVEKFISRPSRRVSLRDFKLKNVGKIKTPLTRKNIYSLND